MYKKDFLKSFIAIMPMAGRGQRFVKFGYNTPKHLIKIRDKPMFERAAMTFSKNIKWIFISQKKFMFHRIFKKSLKEFKSKKNIFLNSYTSGQASTVKKALKFLSANKKIIIHSCDLKFDFNEKELKKKSKMFDVIVFTAKCKKFNLGNSKQFSWVRKNINKNSIEISLKKNFKRDRKKNRVLVGSFIFKNKKVLNHCIKHIFRRKLKINNEYYLDYAAAISEKIGYKLGEIVVNKYISWGSHYEFIEHK